jgi:hypothetical protein
LQVRATGTDGKTASASVRVIVADTRAPEIVFDEPADGDLVSGPVPVEARATDDGALASLTLFLDGASVATSATSPLRFTVDATGLASGLHQLTARAADAGGNRSEVSIGIVVAAPSPQNAERTNLSVGGRPVTIPFDVITAGHVALRLYNRHGDLTRTLVNDDMTPGPHSVDWDARTDTGAPAPSGFYRLLLENATSLFRKLAVVR